jgi:DNA-binding MurR/RpiR family transcriptional regulator
MNRQGGPGLDFDGLVELLRERWEDLSPSHVRIAERVLADPEGLAFMTITDLALVVGVHESTIVRFATSLGLAGYPALTQICRARLKERAQLLRRFDNLEGLTARDNGPLQQAVSFDQANIARTFARIDTNNWEQAVDVLANAPAIFTLGLRKCYAISFLLGYLLRLLRPGVRALDLSAGTLPEDLALLKPGDAFVGIAIHRYTAESVHAFRWAREHGATTIALTDNEASPLARYATHCFYVDTSGVGVLRSMTAFTAIVQALTTDVAAALGSSVKSALTIEESLHDEFGTYAQPEPAT